MEVAAGAMSPLLLKLGGLLVVEYKLENRVKKGKFRGANMRS
jgi:hypothetical protein